MEKIEPDLNKFKINPYKKYRGKIILKSSRTLMKNVYEKKIKLERRYKSKKQNDKELENKISDISSLHERLKTITLLEAVDHFKN